MSSWEGDWKARVRDRVRAAGFATALEYLAAFPLSSTVDLASRLGADVAAYQLELQAQQETGNDPAALARLARSILARLIHSDLPNGWPDHERYVVVVGVFPGSFPALSDACFRVTERLLDVAPHGWRPSGADDPVLLEAFRDWPT